MTAHTNGIAVAIIAGGQSRRMGHDKALLQWDGVSLLERTAHAALSVSGDVLVVGRARPDGWHRDPVRFIPDDHPGCGPLGGLATALRHTSPLILLACDMPLLNEPTLRWLSERARAQAGPNGLAVRNGVQIEPLFSFYTAACLPGAQRRLAAGRRSLHGLIESGGFAFADAPPGVAAALANVNTPEEWDALHIGPISGVDGERDSRKQTGSGYHEGI